MTSEQLHLTELLDAVCYVLTTFNFPVGSSAIERVTTNNDNDSNNMQLLANLKQELLQLPSLASVDMSGEMRFFIQALIESIRATNVIDNLYYGYESFARNGTQRTALIEMQIVKEDVLSVKPRHRVAHKLRIQPDKHTQQWQENDSDLHMTRVKRA